MTYPTHPGATLGGSLTPTQNKTTEFGIRVSPVENGYLVNKFDEGLAVCLTLEEAKTIVNAYFDKCFAPQEEKPQEPQVEPAPLPEGQIV